MFTRLNALFAAIVTTLVFLQAGQAVAEDVHSGLNYIVDNHYISGVSETNIHYGDFDDEWWCTQWGYLGDGGPEICTHILLYHHTAGTDGALYGPSGLLNQAHEQQSGGGSSAVGYFVQSPDIGQWTATAHHYTVRDVYWCSVYISYWGGYELGQCQYQWSDFGYDLGTTNAQVTVPCTAARWGPAFNQAAIPILLGWPPQEPYERAAIMKCVASETFIFFNYTTSFDNTPFDPCKAPVSLGALGSDGSTAAMHTHPFFAFPNQYIGCFGETAPPSQWILDATNEANRNFSANDTAIFKCRRSPFYVRSSINSTIRKLQGTHGTGNCPSTNTVVHQ